MSFDIKHTTLFQGLNASQPRLIARISETKNDPRQFADEGRGSIGCSVTCRRSHSGCVGPLTVDSIEEKMEKKKNDEPVHVIALPFNGALLKAAIWKHENEGKRPRFTVALTRSYKASETAKWSSANYYMRDDLLALGHLSELAHSWIVQNSVIGGTENE